MTKETNELSKSFKGLEDKAKELGFSKFGEIFITDKGENAKARLCWGMHSGAKTAKILLLSLKEPQGDLLSDIALKISWKAPLEDKEQEPVAAIVNDGGGIRYFDLDPFNPHEVDLLPGPKHLHELQRFSREPTFEWSLRVYGVLQEGFNHFHEQVYSTVRDSIDGKNDIIDEVGKFMFLELFRLDHAAEEKVFEYDGKKYTLDEVFNANSFIKGSDKEKKEQVKKVHAAFDHFKLHPDYVVTTEEDSLPIYPKDVHLKLTKPKNFETLIQLLQDLPVFTNNKGEPMGRKGTLKDVSGDILGRAFDVLLRHKFEKEGVGIYLTPKPPKDAMVKIALHDIEEDIDKLTETDENNNPTFRIGDTSGGTLGFIVSLMPQLKKLIMTKVSGDDKTKEKLWNGMLEHSFVSADSSPRMVRLARLNMALQGAKKAKVFRVNSLLTELLTPCSYDLILTNPPFGTPETKTEGQKKNVAEMMAQFRSDLDFEVLYGKKKKPKKPLAQMTPSPQGLAMGGKPNSKGWEAKKSGVDLSVLFLDRCLQLLKPGGRLLMVVPDSILCNSGTQYVREYLIGKKDEKTGDFHGGKAILKAVISLPSDTFALSGTGAKTSILYIQKKNADKDDSQKFADEKQGSVFMAVADTLGFKVKKHQEIYQEGGKFIPNDLVPIVGAYCRGE